MNINAGKRLILLLLIEFEKFQLFRIELIDKHQESLF